MKNIINTIKANREAKEAARIAAERTERVVKIAVNGAWQYNTGNNTKARLDSLMQDFPGLEILINAKSGKAFRVRYNGREESVSWT